MDSIANFSSSNGKIQHSLYQSLWLLASKRVSKRPNKSSNVWSGNVIVPLNIMTSFSATIRRFAPLFPCNFLMSTMFATPLFRRFMAFVRWSPNRGIATTGTPAHAASYALFWPQWLTNTLSFWCAKFANSFIQA